MSNTAERTAYLRACRILQQLFHLTRDEPLTVRRLVGTAFVADQITPFKADHEAEARKLTTGACARITELVEDF